MSVTRYTVVKVGHQFMSLDLVTHAIAYGSADRFEHRAHRWADAHNEQYRAELARRYGSKLTVDGGATSAQS